MASSPLENIKVGILNGNWSDVVLGYRQMTGEVVENPTLKDVRTCTCIYFEEAKHLREAVGRIYAAAAQAFKQVHPEGEPENEADGDVVPRPTLPLPAVVVPPTTDDDEDDDDDDDDEDEDEEQGSEPPPEPTNEPSKRRSALDFTIQHKGVKTDKKTCQVLPFDKNVIKNNFVDDMKKATSDIDIDKRLTHGVAPTERRPPVRKVKIACTRCQKVEKVHPAMVPPKLDAEDERPQYICNSCVGKGKE